MLREGVVAFGTWAYKVQQCGQGNVDSEEVRRREIQVGAHRPCSQYCAFEPLSVLTRRVRKDLVFGDLPRMASSNR